MHRLSREEVGNFDEYIERLSQCKLLNEQEIKVLCDKAKYEVVHSDKFLQRNAMWQTFGPPYTLVEPFMGTFMT